VAGYICIDRVDVIAMGLSGRGPEVAVHSLAPSTHRCCCSPPASVLELEREVGVALHVQCGCAAATRCSRRVTKARSDAVFADRGEAVRSTADLMCDVVLRAWLRCTQGQHLLLQRMVGNVSSHPLSESRAVVELGAMAASIHVSMSAIASSSTGCLGMLTTVVLERQQ
jgi:hypothetical protein